MDETNLPPELIQHLTHVSRLDEREARRLLQEVLRYYSVSVEDFVRRRHSELQKRGWSNAQIYQQIHRELDQQRFPAPTLSERQIRRLIYG